MTSDEYMFDKCILDEDENYPTLQKGIYRENRSGDYPKWV